jgi:predicted methyltransferase
MRAVPVVLLIAALAAATPDAQRRESRAPLSPPQQLALLEGPDRDEWQQPDRVMDALGIADGSRVADLGAGSGWFTIRLARRVGPNGVVYAEDIQREMIASIERTTTREGLRNVVTILGGADDPRLPVGLQAVLMVDTYPQLADPVGVLAKVAPALSPNGRIGIIDFKPDGAGGPGPTIGERVAPDVVTRDAERAGFRLLSHETFLRYQYMLVFAR